MEVNKKQRAIDFRKKGLSVKDISKRLNAAQGSVSTWVRSVVLSPAQKLALKNYCHSPEVVERRRQSRLHNQSVKRKICMDLAADEIGRLNTEMLKVAGVALYWAEGAKTKIGVSRLTNSDPALIKLAMRFFREICKVPESRFRGHIHIHSADAVNRSERYWSEVSQIPLKQFYKTYSIPSKASKHKRLTLPFGTFEIGVCDVGLHLKILGWIEGLKRQTI
jgi:hypothetical protein